MPVAASVQLLGPVTVEAQGPIDAAQRPLLTEVVVAVALHPDGLREEVLQASVWPRGVGDDVLSSTLAAAAEWLGTDAAGRTCLARGDDGLWRLGPAVRLDLAELREIATRPEADTDLDVLREAVALFAGEAGSGVPAGRYGWLAFARAAREARVLGTAVSRRAAELAVTAGHPDEAERLLRAGLRLVPAAEPLWRDLLRLGPWDGPAGATAVVADLVATLRDHRVWPEPETEALIAQVAPDFDGSPTAATG